MTRGLSFAIGTTVLAVTLAMTLRAPAVPDHRMERAYELTPEGQLAFVVPPDTESLELVTHLLDADPGLDPVHAQHPYAVRIAWHIDDAPDPLGAQVVHERTRVLPLDASPGPRATLVDATRTVGDARSHDVQWMGTGAVLTVDQAVHPVLVQLVARRPRDAWSRRRLAHAPSRRVRTGWAHLLGLPGPDGLTAWMQERLAVPRADRLTPRQADRPARPLRTVRDPTPLEAMEAHALVLAPGRELVVGFRHAPTAALRILAEGQGSLVAAWLDHPASRIPVAAGRATSLPPPPQGPAWLHLAHTGGDRPMPVQIVHDGPAPLLGWAAQAPASDAGRDWRIAPEWRLRRAWSVDARDALTWATTASDHDSTWRVRVRAVLEGPDDRRDTALRLVGLDPSGGTAWSADWVEPPHPDPFDHGLDIGPGGWLGEATTRYLTVPAGTHAVRVEADVPALVQIATLGLPRPEAPDYLPDAPDPPLRHRLGPATTWRTLDPVDATTHDAAGRRRTLATQVRPLGLDADPRTETRTYHTLDPSGQRTLESRRTWLVAPTHDDEGVLYCPLGGSGGRSAPWTDAAVARFDGRVRAVLWAEPSAMGSTWALERAGRTVRSGRVQQPVTVMSEAPVPDGRLALRAQPGLVAWVRTQAPPEACVGARRPVHYHPLDPGEHLVVHPEAHPEGRWLSIAGLAEGTAHLRAVLDDGQPEVTPSRLAVDRTAPVRPLTLPQPDDAPLALALRDPSARQPVLRSAPLHLGQDLTPGRHRLVLHNDGDQRVWVRVAQEAKESPP